MQLRGEQHMVRSVTYWEWLEELSLSFLGRRQRWYECSHAQNMYSSFLQNQQEKSSVGCWEEKWFRLHIFLLIERATEHWLLQRLPASSILNIFESSWGWSKSAPFYLKEGDRLNQGCLFCPPFIGCLDNLSSLLPARSQCDPAELFEGGSPWPAHSSVERSLIWWMHVSFPNQRSTRAIQGGWWLGEGCCHCRLSAQSSYSAQV